VSTGVRVHLYRAFKPHRTPHGGDMWRRVLPLAPLAVAALLLVLATARYAYAGPSYLAVVDQRGVPVRHAVVEVVGGKAVRINDSHWAVEAEGSFIVRILLYNVTIFQRTLTPGNYTLKTLVVPMHIVAPPEVKVEICLVGSNRCWSFHGHTEYTLKQVPVGTYRIRVKGVVETEKTVYFTGGTIRVGSDVYVDYRLAPLLALTLLVPGAYLTREKLKSRRRRLAKHEKKTKTHETKVSNKKEKRLRTIQQKKKEKRKKRREQETLAEILQRIPA